MSLKLMVAGGRWWLAVGLASSLMACAAPTGRAVPASAVSTAPVKPLRLAQAEPAPPAVQQPAAAPQAAPAPEPRPYSEAVAARFPDPVVDLPTPAFAPGHAGFTSNDELHALIAGLVRDGRGERASIKLLPLGRSQSGLPIEGLLFTKLADTDPAAIAASNRLTVMLVGQQHGDEPAGSEALMVVAQELAHGRLEPLLDRINVVMIPRANPDGAQERNRVTASGIDMNRDHLLLKTPEAQSVAQLARDYHPAVIVDSHEYSVVGRYLQKFDAVQKFDALVQYAMTANEPPFITKAAAEWFREPLLASFKAEGLTQEWYYTTSTDLADRKVSMGGVQPDTGRNVNGLKNAVSFLIETRGVGIGRLHLKRRVFTHVTALGSILQSAALKSAEMAKLRAFVEQDVSSRACQGEVVVEAAATPSEYVLHMLDPVTGADKPLTVAWDSALELRTLKKRTRPCGYWLSNDQADAVLRLRGLGVTVMQLGADGDMRAETYRELSRDTGARPDVRGTVADVNGIVKVQVQTVPTLIDVKGGSYFVPLDQPLANLVVAAMEPDTQNSYFANGIVTNLGAQARVMSLPTVTMSTLP
jgi:hypothetical protein